MNIPYDRTTVRTLRVAAICSIAFSSFVQAASETKTPSPPPPTPAAKSPPATAPAATPAKTPGPTPAKPLTPSPAPTPTTTAQVSTNPESHGIQPGNGAPVRLEEVEVSGDRVTAVTQAPTDSSLDAFQPQSVINLQFIANNLPATADYSTIANVAPSVVSLVTNGPGLSDARRTTIRGIDDSQYNVTYDGIPFIDNGDQAHRSTAYFPAKMIGRVIVDRGPGTSSDIGNASFGGTIALFSKDPRSDLAIIPTFSYGSYNTSLSHIEGNTGLLNSLNRASLIASYQYMATDGFQSFVSLRRNTTYFKYLQPIGKNSTLTVLSNYNQLKNNLSLPATQAQIDKFGHNFGLTNDPKDTYYYGYNNRLSQNDFDYIGFETTIAETWHIDNKLYTYRSFIRGNGNASFAANGDALVRYQNSDWRSVGDYLVVSHDDRFGVLKAGLWFESARNPRYQFSSNFTQGRIINTTAARTVGGYYYNLTLDTTSTNFFADYNWHATKELVINIGGKEVSFDRSNKGSVNQNSLKPIDYSHTDRKFVPYLAGNYSLRNDWTVYAQAAQGFLSPRGDYVYVTNPGNDQLKPRETTNYQVGTVFKTDRLNADFDAYWIDYKNFPVQTQDPSSGSSADQIFILANGAYYSGIEAQATYLVVDGTSLYVNGSINHGKYKRSKLDIDKNAQGTASAGLLYDRRGIFGSFIAKYTGLSKVYNSASFNPNDASSVTGVLNSGGYVIANASLGYSMKLDSKFIRSVKVRLEVGNVFDRIVKVADRYQGGAAQFDVIPERNYFITVSGEF